MGCGFDSLHWLQTSLQVPGLQGGYLLVYCDCSRAVILNAAFVPFAGFAIFLQLV